VPPAPGIPHALFYLRVEVLGKVRARSAPRNALTCVCNWLSENLGLGVPAKAGIYRVGSQAVSAEPVIGRAFARPVGLAGTTFEDNAGAVKRGSRRGNKLR
jgi:hypothetical protein